MAEVFPIKVCGLTRLEDAQQAVDLGAMALGFIFYPKSPRYISPEKVHSILSQLKAPAKLLSVGVFVNADRETLLETQQKSGIQILQLHGDETPELCASLSEQRLWKAIRLKDKEQLSALSLYEPHIEAFLFDAAVEGAYGGTGHAVKTELLEVIPRRKPIIIAGGITPENWECIYDHHSPWAIDLSSGVESSPGIKDPEKLNKLFRRTRVIS